MNDPPSTSRGFHFLIWGMVLPLIICAARAVPILLDPGIPTDTENTFLPLARMLLDDPGELWRSTDLLKTGIGTYGYMALLGADMTAIKTANVILSLCSLIMIFDTARKVGGWWAACAAAWLYALSPTLFFWTVYPMGEPVFLFLIVTWFWGCAHLSFSAALSKPRAISLVILAALALGLATLTRGTYMYWIPLIGFGSIFIAALPRWRGNPIAIHLAAVHLVALLLVGSYMLKNQADFGRPLISTGAGNALYYGNNPMFQGEEPPLFGVSYDAFYVMGRHPHLSLEGDEQELAAVRKIIASTPAGTLASMYLHKAGAFLFFSTSHLKNYGDRAWRTLLITMALLGFWAYRKQPMAWLLLGTAAYQCAVHLPVLYNPRYSITAIDIQLTLLAGLWLGHVLQIRKSSVHAAWLLVVICAIALAAAHQRFSPKLMPDMSIVPPYAQVTASPSELSWSGLSGSPFGQNAHAASGKFTVQWSSTRLLSGELSFVGLSINKWNGECKRVWIRNTRTDGQTKEVVVPLRGFGKDRDFYWGLTHVDLPGTGGILQLTFECKPNIEVQFGELGIYNASIGYQFRDRSVHH